MNTNPKMPGELWSPSCTVVLGPDADRIEWLKARRIGVGASEAAKVMGLSEWETPLGVWRSKRSTADPVDRPPSEAARWGHLLEPVIADVYAEDYGVQLEHVGLLQSVEWPWMLATPDRAVIGERRLIEIKSTDHNSYHLWADGSTPVDASMQAQQQMAVTGYEEVTVVVLLCRGELQTRHIARDDQLIQEMAELERKFWFDHVLTGDAPGVTCKDARHLLEMFPEPAPKAELELPVEAHYLIADYREAQAEIKEAKNRADLAANQLKMMMGTNEVGTLNGSQAFTWKASQVQKFNRDAFEVDHPELAQQYTQTKSERRIRIGKA